MFVKCKHMYVLSIQYSSERAISEGTPVRAISSDRSKIILVMVEWKPWKAETKTGKIRFLKGLVGKARLSVIRQHVIDRSYLIPQPYFEEIITDEA
ncbi:unnamed protein product [Onchocerca flexuosa]|uniref:DUF5641 domain-containing protein n=1 Tax=Onchocerca flexuosa TaxID=387005 RepID=A0A183I434_9BILA|nr:unnamed protein product [Onchocerca flexuosa]